MVSLSDIPVYEGTLVERIVAIVRFIDANIRKSYWTNDIVDEKYAKRSAEQILDDKDTFYMNSCLDYTLVSLQILKINGFRTKLIMEELIDSMYPCNPLHFAIEFEFEQRIYFLAYPTGNTVVLGQGSYVNSKCLPVVRSVKVDGSSIKPHDNLLGILDINVIDDLKKVFLGYDYNMHVAKLKRDNTAEKFKKYSDSFGGDLGLKLVVDSKHN